MQVKNAIIFFAGCFIASVITSHICISADKEIERDVRASKAALLRINGTLKAYPTTRHDYVESLWAYVLAKLLPRKHLTVRSVRFSKALMYTFIVVGILCVLLGFYFMLHINGNC